MILKKHPMKNGTLERADDASKRHVDRRGEKRRGGENIQPPDLRGRILKGDALRGVRQVLG